MHAQVGAQLVSDALLDPRGGLGVRTEVVLWLDGRLRLGGGGGQIRRCESLCCPHRRGNRRGEAGNDKNFSVACTTSFGNDEVSKRVKSKSSQV